MKKIIFLNFILIFFITNNIFSFPYYEYSPEFPHAGQKLELFFQENPNFKYIYINFNLPIVKSKEGIEIENFLKMDYGKVSITLPQNCALVYFYIEDINGNILKEEDVGSFIHVYNLNNKPVKNTFFYKAMILQRFFPGMYNVENIINEELRYHPDNFPALYFLWSLNNLFANQDILNFKLDSLQDIYSTDPDFYLFKGKICEKILDFQGALNSYFDALKKSNGNKDFKFKVVKNILKIISDTSKKLMPIIEESVSDSCYNDVDFYKLLMVKLKSFNRTLYQSKLNFFKNDKCESLKEVCYLMETIDIVSSYRKNDSILLAGNLEFLKYYAKNLTLFDHLHILNLLSLDDNLRKYYIDYAYEVEKKLDLLLRGNNSQEVNNLQVGLYSNLSWAFYLDENLNKSLEYLRKIENILEVPDDVLFFRMGNIYYSSGDLSSALEYVGKSYLLNYSRDVFDFFEKIYKELYLNDVGMKSYLEGLKSSLYTKIELPYVLPLNKIQVYKKIVLIFLSPFYEVDFDKMDKLSSLSRAFLDVNFFILLPEFSKENDEYIKLIKHYGLPIYFYETQRLPDYFKGVLNENIFLVDENKFLVNRIDFIRSDWYDIVYNFLKENF